MTKGSIPVDDNYKPVLALYDDNSGNIYPVHISSLVTGADGKTYAVMDTVAGGGGGGGGAVTVADGADVTLGTKTQTKATDGTTTAWSAIQLLKGIFDKLLGNVAVTEASASASKTNLDSLVTNTADLLADGDFLTTIATNTTGLNGTISASRVQGGRTTTAVYSLASTATTSSSNSGDLTVGAYTEISIDITTTAKTGTTPTIQFIYARKAADGIYYDIWQSTTISNVAANTISTSIGAGMAYNQSLGVTGQLRWVIGGSATPGYTFSINIQGK